MRLPRLILLATCAFLASLLPSFAGPIVDTNEFPFRLYSEFTLTFDDLQHTIPQGCGGGPDSLGGCVNFKIVGGSGTIKIDILDEFGSEYLRAGLEQWPLIDADKNQGITFGTPTIADPNSTFIARVTITGDLLFEHFSLSIGVGLPDPARPGRAITYSQRQSFGNVPHFVPEPSSLLLWSLSGGIVIASRIVTRRAISRRPNA